jgi:NTP pyrophosphatase (non-canonical NTP hydrolase)
METKNLNQMANEIHANAVEHGFYNDECNAYAKTWNINIVVKALKSAFFAQKIALIHSELSEALEAHRKGNFVQSPELEWALSTADESHLFDEHFPEKIKNTVEDELADVIIRVLDLCGYLDINIQAHVDLKMKYNRRREYKHGKKY